MVVDGATESINTASSVGEKMSGEEYVYGGILSGGEICILEIISGMGGNVSKGGKSPEGILSGGKCPGGNLSYIQHLHVALS